ncbi:hypothetical protein E2F50_12115 [Rhizobium deserti]|uniref:Uncharacterized protein n=1 Tax=Rhizobium deserti TaxID=2547961 RepID=A0A4R5UKX9_9HYPH|nr:hypothetical protein [Rhizobium deserti]TDK37582.1 hypothetical protein E2F50_12115 [Rhizobium deserti]
MQSEETSIAIDNRNDYKLWAIERAKEIVSQQGTGLALAVRDGEEEIIRTAGNALGSAITEALIEVFDGLLSEG